MLVFFKDGSFGVLIKVTGYTLTFERDGWRWSAWVSDVIGAYPIL